MFVLCRQTLYRSDLWLRLSCPNPISQYPHSWHWTSTSVSWRTKCILLCQAMCLIAGRPLGIFFLQTFYLFCNKMHLSHNRQVGQWGMSVHDSIIKLNKIWVPLRSHDIDTFQLATLYSVTELSYICQYLNNLNKTILISKT